MDKLMVGGTVFHKHNFWFFLFLFFFIFSFYYCLFVVGLHPFSGISYVLVCR